ncbi:two-component regulator propeller domain-containing protein [Draconibacterium sp. IB214405]|uniref:two-component regulator propeller domain-containing protein n=1 Tax=Draconibacterium sp. IB214405 TaxID=3097352 RepID=UPI002A11ADFF|nr:two-component regulator propeller domain-containing protein [Draconibacterium sp. IB214405]MDX8338979.1 two-component regulator propeller domain-containing protein [Draconibacterium sp. IB214405]
MRNRFKIFTFSVFILLSSFVFANGGKLTFTHYTNDDGLPSSYIKSICQDQFGFIWAATRSSVCRFDGKYFKTFQAVDEQGNYFDIWSKWNHFHQVDSTLLVQTTDDVFYSFNFNKEIFEPYHPINDLGDVYELRESKIGYWVLKSDTICLFDTKTNQLKDFNDYVSFAPALEGVEILNIREKNDRLMAVTNDRRLLIYDLKREQQRYFELPEGIYVEGLSHLYIDNSNYAWIGNYADGLYQINLTNGQSRRFTAEQNGNRHLLHNLVHTLNEDQQGRVWIGTEDGLCVWSPYTESFDYYQHDIRNPQGLNTNPIYNIFNDRDGNMWLATYFGGINFWNNTPEFFHVWQAGTGIQHLAGSAVSCIAEDENGHIWVGMEDMGINQIDLEKDEIIREVNESNGLSFNNVHDLLFETPDRLWIATYTGGVNILNLKNNRFEYLNTSNHPELPSNDIYSLLHVGDSVFISTSAGVAVYNSLEKRLYRYEPDIFDGIQVEFMYDSEDRIWFSAFIGTYYFDKKKRTFGTLDKFNFLKNINFAKTDSKNRVWLGDCLQGLYGYDLDNDTIYEYNETNGFPFSWIFSLEEGRDGYLWASGDKGLAKFKPETGEIVWYNRESGLPFEQFNYRASYKSRDGEIYFGANRGMISFNERNKPEIKKELDVVFRGMQLFNQEMVPGEDQALEQSLNLHPEIRLKYKQNVFTIEYAGLNFQNKGNCQYAYYLENFENSWNYVGTRDFATYTNLGPGEYYFHVKASTDNAEWGTKANSLKIIIEPPFWLSKWGFFMYFLLLILLLVSFYVVATRIQKSKALAEMERREKDYLTELNNFKLEFFTNVSHELRTPLTLIVGPLTRILEDEKLTPALNKKMKGIKNNAHRLLTLVNQLLEFRKIENGKEKLKVSHQNITTLLKDVEEAFMESAESKSIAFDFEIINLESNIWVDYQKLENVLINLISNALKFTREGGEVKVSVELLSKELAFKTLRITVADNGIGIDSSKLKKIFDRFYHADGGSDPQVAGSGIGLALVNSLVKLHKGTIDVKSTVGEGAVFTVKLPVSRKAYQDSEVLIGAEQYIPHITLADDLKQAPMLRDEVERLSAQPTILVIDDNRELLEFISETLADNYKVITAIDGSQGMEKVEEALPDLIISDVMMPGIDGFELTRKLKSDLRTSHIPVVLLTAKSGEENEYEGLQTGADYYIEKPFLPHILIKLIENVLHTRRSLIERFKSDAKMLPTEVATSESDKELIDKISKLIKENIDRPNLDVSFLVNEIGISRSLLHVKLKKLTDCSATEFIRSIRLREAVKLIAEGKCNISEAAYKTGFSSPAYFSRRFKEYFGVTPKAYFDN